MANLNAPIGFMPIRNKATLGGLNNSYTITSSDTALFGIGDVVKRSSGRTITKALPSETPIGIFQGWRFRTRSPYGGSMGAAADGRVTTHFKAWNGAITVPTNMAIEADIDDDPLQTFKVLASQAVVEADIGKLVDLVDCPAGPDVTVFGRGRQAVGYPTTYYNIDTYTVGGGGSGFTQNQVDLVVNGVIQIIRPADITVTAGAIASISLLNKVQGLPSNSPTVTVQPKPGYSGSGASITPNMSGAQTAAQFRIERILEMPVRNANTANVTTGFDLSSTGQFALLEVAFAKHGRGGSAMYVA